MSSEKKDTLPIHVDEQVLEKNPKFSNLLRLLSNKLTPDGVTVQTRRDAEMAERNLYLARQRWLMSHIPYYELRELITDLELKSIEGTLSLDEEQMTEVLSEAVALCDLGDYLPLPSDTSHTPTLLGLTHDDLDRHNHTKQHLPVICKVVLPMLERRLQEKGKDLLNFCATQDSESRSDWASSLPCFVEETMHQIVRDKASLKVLKQKERANFLLYYQTLLNCLSSFERLIGHHKLEIQSVNDEIQLECMEAWCGAICTKISLMLLQLSRDTYTADKVNALKRIRRHLDKAIVETERELSTTSHQVDTYRAVSGELKPLVDQYTCLRKEVGDLRWGLDLFAQSEEEKH